MKQWLEAPPVPTHRYTRPSRRDFTSKAARIQCTACTEVGIALYFFLKGKNGFYCGLPSSTEQLADIWNMFSCRCHRSLVVETVVDVPPPASASAFLQPLLLGRQIADLYIYIKTKQQQHFATTIHSSSYGTKALEEGSRDCV